nr:hypothetical protein [uncultured Mediterranean phage uvMED]
MPSIMMLTQAHNMVYYDSALAKSSAGLRNSENERNKALNRSAFFMPLVYGRLYGVASASRTRSGVSSSVQSAAFCLETNGGSSLKQNEATTMSNIYNLSARQSKSEDTYDLSLRLNKAQMEAFEILLFNLLEDDLSQFTRGNKLSAMHALKAIENTINAISEFGDVQ